MKKNTEQGRNSNFPRLERVLTAYIFTVHEGVCFIALFLVLARARANYENV